MLSHISSGPLLFALLAVFIALVATVKSLLLQSFKSHGGCCSPASAQTQTEKGGKKKNLSLKLPKQTLSHLTTE